MVRHATSCSRARVFASRTRVSTSSFPFLSRTGGARQTSNNWKHAKSSPFVCVVSPSLTKRDRTPRIIHRAYRHHDRPPCSRFSKYFLSRCTCARPRANSAFQSSGATVLYAQLRLANLGTAPRPRTRRSSRRGASTRGRRGRTICCRRLKSRIECDVANRTGLSFRKLSRAWRLSGT